MSDGEGAGEGGGAGGASPSVGEVAPARPVAADSLLTDVLWERPGAARVLYEAFGLPCVECELRWIETVADAAAYRDLPPEELVARLDACLPRRPPQPPDASGQGQGA